MGLLVRVIKKQTPRGKSKNWHEVMTFDSPGVFDIPYKSDVHRRFVLREIRSLTRLKGRGRKDNSAIAYELKEARLWQEAIRRSAPLLNGFLGEEPEWREKMLSWCKIVLAKHTPSGTIRSTS
jgi:hypothetical protein